MHCTLENSIINSNYGKDHQTDIADSAVVANKVVVVRPQSKLHS